MPRTEPTTPTPIPALGAASHGWRSRIRRDVESLALQAHRQAERFDLVPAEFGHAAPVDEADARAVAREWIRLLHVWVDENPERVFALKVGAVLLGATLLGLWFLVGMIG